MRLFAYQDREAMAMTFLQIQNPIRWMFLLHALCGAIALGVFLIPLLSSKGGKLHKRTGWVYTAVMVIVGLSAYIITPWRAFFLIRKRTSSSQSFAIFLFFIETLTLAALWHGIVVLRFKRRIAPSRALIHIGPSAALVIAAIIVEIVGIQSGSPLLIAFPFVGISVARAQLKYWLNAPTERMHWWYAHMEGMCSACIATITGISS
jgi:uncharacterized membrane protein